MGVGTDFILGAIADGKLQAEVIPTGDRRIIRIHLDHFIAYLEAIGWKRLPPRPGEPRV